MQGIFLRDKLREGLNVHVRTSTLFGKTIRRTLGRPFRKLGLPDCRGNHDALLACRRGVWGTLDSQVPTSRFNPLEKLEHGMADGKVWCMVFEPIHASPEQMRLAVEWWGRKVEGRVYDFAAFPKLFAKAIFAPLSSRAAGMTWMWYCTEGAASAYLRGAGLDVWCNLSPTPLTTEKRAGMYPMIPGPVTLRDVTAEVMVPVADWGLAERLGVGV